MKKESKCKFSLDRIWFEPWQDRYSNNLEWGQFSFFVSLQAANSAIIVPESLRASFTDSSGTEWNYCGFEAISNEKPWKAELLFQSTHLKDSADLLIEHGKLSISFSGHHEPHSQHFDIHHDGLFGHLTSSEAAF